ncbi:MAG: cyclic nucleotide-binding domain-containing protein [Bdellovibrionota bacterium]
MVDPSVLKNIYLFQELSDAHLKEVASICHEEEAKVGTTVFKEGEKGDKLFIILSGEIRISKQIPGVGEEALAVLKQGAFFGEMALIDDSERSADAIANKSCKLATISREDFEQFLFVNKDIAYTILWSFARTLSERLRETNDKIKAFFAMTMFGSGGQQGPPP